MTSSDSGSFCFQQIHIEAARNSTDDFNLFHDKRKWQRIKDNPFGGPIALGFQLECLIEYQIRLHREQHDELRLIRDHNLKFSNYQFTFANAVRPDENIQLEVKPSQLREGDNTTLANRVVLKGERGMILLGHKKESRHPLFLPDPDLPELPNLDWLPDRSWLPDQPFFLKRKYMNVGNAKNFLSGSLAEQADYFDELEDKIIFPEIFPVALTSCALLERAQKEHLDFERDPMVYTSHAISIDRHLLAGIRSNDILHFLVRPLETTASQRGLGKSSIPQTVFHCYGLLKDNSMLFRAEIALTPLQAILKTGR